MKQSLIGLLLLLSSALIVRAEERSVAVSVRQPLMRLVRRAQVEETCGLRGVAACTAFVGQRLECACDRSAQGWTVRASAQFIPLIVLSDATWASHEYEHIADVRDSLTSHLLVLESRTFESDAACAREAREQVDGFVELMNRFKLESNRARHPRFAAMKMPKQ